MTRLILPICIISLLSGCQDANPAEREWKEQLYKNLAIVGARNWIVIAESSFPAYTGTGIRTRGGVGRAAARQSKGERHSTRGGKCAKLLQLHNQSPSGDLV